MCWLAGVGSAVVPSRKIFLQTVSGDDFGRLGENQEIVAQRHSAVGLPSSPRDAGPNKLPLSLESRMPVSPKDHPLENASAESPGGPEKPATGAADFVSIDQYLELVAGLAETAPTREDFYLPLLKKLPLVSKVEKCGLLARFNEQLNLAYFADSTGVAASQQRAAGSLFHAVRQLLAEHPKVVSGVEFVGQFSLEDSLGLLFGCHPEGQPELFLACLLQATVPAETLALYRELLEELTRIIAKFESRNSLQIQKERMAEVGLLSRALLNLAGAKSVREMAYSFSNDLAQVCQADRVSIFDSRGRVLAISHVDNFSNRSKVVRQLRKVARQVSREGQPISCIGGRAVAASLKTSNAAKSLLETSGAHAVLARRLGGSTENNGVALAEYFAPLEADWIERNRRFDSVLEFCGPVFAKAFQIHSIPFSGPLSWFFRVVLSRPLRTALLCSAFGFICWSLLSWLNSQPASFEITARGRLAPSTQQGVFAPVEGRIREVFVGEGDNVNLGQPLFRMQSLELEQVNARLSGELQEALKRLDLSRAEEQLAKAEISPDKSERERVRRSFEIQQLELRIATLRELLQRNQLQLDELNVNAPLSGVITTRQVELSLSDRPVEAGQPLLNIANLAGEWEILLDVEERRICYVLEALETAKSSNESLSVRLKFASAPTREYRGTVREIDFTGQRNEAVDEALNTMVKVVVDVEESELAELLRLGAGVDARLVCGKRSLAFLFTYELRDKINEWFFFWR